MTTADDTIRCCRCRFKHLHSQRVGRVRKMAASSSLRMEVLCCPRCHCTTFYELKPQVAWCWASGLIEFGDVAPEEAIVIATGPKFALKSQVEVVARHGKGASAGLLLVPGVPEAKSQKDKGDALAAWLRWRAKAKGRDGVVWATEVKEVSHAPA